jgi:hypothetical protein
MRDRDRNRDREARVYPSLPRTVVHLALLCRYSELLCSVEFWEAIPTENILIFQEDSMICSKSQRSLLDFLEYDYIGAPWPTGRVGNGTPPPFLPFRSISTGTAQYTCIQTRTDPPYG